MTKKHKEISVTELRKDLPMILQRVALLKESFIVVKHGKKFCIIKPVEAPRK